jgi:uncharacterized sulfatase
MDGDILVAETEVRGDLRAWLENSIRRFFPAAFTFTGVFVLLRVYEFILLRGTIGTHMNLLSLEFGSLLYDVIFSFSLITVVLIIYLAMCFLGMKAAKLVTVSLFTVVIVLNFITIQYFSTTQSPLGEEVFQYSVEDILRNIFNYWGVRWTTITPIIVLMPLAIAGFSAMKEWMIFNHIPQGLVVGSVALFFLSCFLPKSPSPDKFHRSVDFYVATNKTHFFLSKTLHYAQSELRQKDEEKPVVHKRGGAKTWR